MIGRCSRLSMGACLLAATLVACGGGSSGSSGPGTKDDAAPADDTPDGPPARLDTASTPAPDAAAPEDTRASEPDAAVPSPDAARDGTAPVGVVKMMVMGSSNEVGTCWRAFLWQKLRAMGVTSFDFVGSMSDGPACGVPGYDKDDESRNGTIVSDITAAQFNMRFKANPPDIVLVHFGGADLLQGIAPDKVIPGYTLMVTQGRAVNPRIRFLVAEHTPMTPSSCPKCPMTVPELNAATVAWAKQISTAESPVSTVDLFTGLDPATDTSDRVHLNEAGAQKVSDRWVQALLPILKP